MDFSKYLSLLDRQALFFPRVDRLGDPFEGSVGALNKPVREATFTEAAGIDPAKKAEVLARLGRFFEWQRQWTFVNCWHMNEHESAAMWRLYARTNEAIAIQSTFDTVASCLPDSVLIGQVQNVDYATSFIPDGNLFYPLMHKRRSFEHEREVRALMQELPQNEVGINSGAVNGEAGRYISVDLARLVRGVLVAPTSPVWFLEVVQNVTKKYGLSVQVNQSALDSKPLF